jgi:hypothetical protein
MRRRLLLGFLAAILPLLVAATPALADDSDYSTRTSAASTYEAVPGKGLVKVGVTYKVRNDIPDEVESYACSESYFDPYFGWTTYPSICTRTIRTYITSAYLVLESDAAKLKVTVGGRKAKIRKVDSTGGFATYKVTIPKTYLGQTRTIKASYVIKSGPPRSGSTVRMNGAYMNFWGIAQLADRSSVKVVVPDTFATSAVGGTVRESTKGGKRTYSSGSITDGSAFFVGITGTDLDGFAEAALTTASGRDVLIQGWPGDDEWMTAVRSEADAALSRLEDIVGEPAPGNGPITLREVAGGTLGDAYIATYDPEQRLASVSEEYREEGTVAHELSHAWFNGSLFASTWMSEGYAGWAERAVGANATPCEAPAGVSGRFPTRTLALADWQVADPRTTPEQFQAISDQYDASCALVSQVADALGIDGMRAVLAVMATPAGAYPGTRDPDPGPADWRQWLDAVEEQGMVDEWGRSILSVTLVRYGVATKAELAGREESRSALLGLSQRGGDFWTIPQAVYRSMGAWDFPTADRTMAEMTATMETIYGVSHALDGVSPVDNPLRGRLAAAMTLGDLVEVRQQAEAQLEAATAVAEADARASADQGPLGELGLIGTDWASLFEPAVDDVASLDLDGAAAQVDVIDATLAAAPGIGAMRLGGTVAVLLVVLSSAFLVIRRRRRGRVAAAETAVPEAASEAAPDPV